MFLNKTQLKKLIKGSFNHEGLFVGRIYNGLVIAGGTWITWAGDGYIPNWVKAAVMEYTGELPGIGHAFKAKKNEPIQYEVADNTLYDLPSMAVKCCTAYTVTPVIVENKYGTEIRMLQRVSDREIRPLPEDAYRLIDLSELVDENAPIGPMSTDDHSMLVLWKNEFSAYACMMFYDTTGDVKDVMEAVRRVDFCGEGR